jgi:hypothetical protein
MACRIALMAALEAVAIPFDIQFRGGAHDIKVQLIIATKITSHQIAKLGVSSVVGRRKGE